MNGRHFRRVGSVRPSHLMFTSGVGALVDLPNFSVLVQGLDEWRDAGVPVESQTIADVPPHLLRAVRKLAGRSVKELRPAPWAPGSDQLRADDPSLRIGVPAVPFPGWLRCTACNELAPIASKAFGFENSRVRRPHDARFFHANCGRKRSGRAPLAVAARFVLACQAGHLDDFPYVLFVHNGSSCPDGAEHPRLRMEDRGGMLGANVQLSCLVCGASRNIRQALGERGRESLPYCRGRHPHLGNHFEECGNEAKLLVVGASNQWFAQTLNALAVPKPAADELQAKVDVHWAALEALPGVEMMPYLRTVVPALREFEKWDDAEIWAAVQARRTGGGAGTEDDAAPDLLAPEWEAFTTDRAPDPSDDFTISRSADGVPALLKNLLDDVVQVERLREVRALVGFTRLDAPDPEDPDLVERAPLSRGEPTWLPGAEVRGEGIFLRLPEELMQDWEARVDDAPELRAHLEAYGRFRANRYSDRLGQGFDRFALWPEARYVALHTLSHLLIRTIALECGYNAASLSERIYTTSRDGEPRAGILIYTAVPDAEGTLGGLVSQAEPRTLERLVRQALQQAMHCSSDPLCAERLPHAPADFLHGAACHVCLFLSETTCERGNRFLDRRFVVPIDNPGLALFRDLP
ncbi:uncharacterized protein DUF1998 [Kribbella sp. VKM Ac-2527]|uniref:Uncharacterized protein DUF1998 n=1 Tax=Kribbella caucasensis TaxID=2512215 RepID=A0A4R6J4W6_9ACTN|nr:DUF1998 domain-containing protein [Kribbella sp. VKM Ac-2527]TDO30037.1 uncharacterized protein DUF1998 [Kribbella sp. VKM Ac-2527]